MRWISMNQKNSVPSFSFYQEHILIISLLVWEKLKKCICSCIFFIMWSVRRHMVIMFFVVDELSTQHHHFSWYFGQLNIRLSDGEPRVILYNQNVIQLKWGISDVYIYVIITHLSYCQSMANDFLRRNFDFFIGWKSDIFLITRDLIMQREWTVHQRIIFKVV